MGRTAGKDWTERGKEKRIGEQRYQINIFRIVWAISQRRTFGVGLHFLA
jgi:hypothetical protein